MLTNTKGVDGIITRDARNRSKGDADGAFGAEAHGAGCTARVEIEISRSVPPDAVAAVLGHADEVLVRKHRVFDGERPVELATTYLPRFVEEVAPRVAHVDAGEGGIVSRMADAGLAQTYVIEEVQQVLATPETAEALGLCDGDPLLAVTHIARSEDGRVLEVTRHAFGPGWRLRYGVPLD